MRAAKALTAVVLTVGALTAGAGTAVAAEQSVTTRYFESQPQCRAYAVGVVAAGRTIITNCKAVSGLFELQYS